LLPVDNNRECKLVAGALAQNASGRHTIARGKNGARVPF